MHEHTLFDARATKKTGLTYQKLQQDGLPWATVWKMFSVWVDKIRENNPVALLFHNGASFDFPVLQNNLQKLNLQWPQEYVGVDSLRVLRNLHPSKTSHSVASYATSQQVPASSLHEALADCTVIRNAVLGSSDTIYSVSCSQSCSQNEKNEKPQSH